MSVTEKVVGYKKVKFQTHENAGYGDVRLPEMQMHTTAFWLTLQTKDVDGLRGVGIALETVSSFSLMCDARDIGMAIDDERAAVDGSVTLFLYEHVPGGTGLCERMFGMRTDLLARAKRLIETCPCKSGCPACVGPAQNSRKAAALSLLETC